MYWSTCLFPICSCIALILCSSWLLVSFASSSRCSQAWVACSMRKSNKLRYFGGHLRRQGHNTQKSTHWRYKSSSSMIDWTNTWCYWQNRTCFRKLFSHTVLIVSACSLVKPDQKQCEHKGSKVVFNNVKQAACYSYNNMLPWNLKTNADYHKL